MVGEKRRWDIPAVLYLAYLSFAGVNAWGQGEASIAGEVSDATRAAIVGATVTAQETETGTVRKVVTDASGNYEIGLLGVGTYNLTVEKAGFQIEEKTGVALVLGQRAVVNFDLQLGEVKQTIQVTEDVQGVAVSTVYTSGLVSERQVRNLPLNGRSFDNLLTLNPGIINVTAQRAGGAGTSASVVGNMFSVSGRRPETNLFLLNGVEYTGSSNINVTPGGASGQLLGVDAIREFQVEKDTYGAAYGKRAGAQINIVTTSGTNDLHGTLYEFLRNSALDARNFFDHGAIPPLRRNVFGGSLGGPVKKNKTFLFGNYEGFRQRLGLSNVTLVPDNASRAAAVASVQPLLALWPVANGPELGGGIAIAYNLYDVASPAAFGLRPIFLRRAPFGIDKRHL
ncbi:MAG: carboxypeptidase regulatory-like domain-containing protein [Bryobacteraceae bacterium]